MQDQYLYVIVRKDLPSPQVAIQACHAVERSCLKCSHPVDLAERTIRIPNIVLLAVENEQELVLASQYLTSYNIQHALFREPDMGDQATALATNVVYQDKRKFFRSFKLLE